MRQFFGRFSRSSMAFVCAGFSAVVLALCIFGGAHFKRGIEREFYRETGNTARILMAGFEDDATTANAILTRLAAQIPVANITAERETELHQLLARYVLHPSMIGPGIIDRTGTLVASALADPISKVSLKDRSIFRFHADNSGAPSLYISAPTRGALTNEWSIQFSRPLRDEADTFYGVVLASYRLSHFIEVYEKLKLSDGGLASLTGMDGIVRIRSLSGEIGYGSSVLNLPLVYQRIIAGERSGTFYGRGGLDGVARIGSFVASQTTPFYVTVGYDEDTFRAQYIGFFYVLALCWFILTAAMIGAVVFIHSLEQMNQRMQLEVVNSAIAERQNLSADMHDSIGASLATLLAHFTTDNINPTAVKRRISEILMELRFLVDSAEPIDGDLNIVVSNVRHRMGSGLELAGIKLEWHVSEFPRIAGLTASDALSIKLIMMEALSNILHHSKAKTAALTAKYAEQASAVVIDIHDDGCGFDVADAAAAGRGISNMRKRIRTISTGGMLVIDSSPKQGTTIHIELNVPPSK